MAFLSLNLIAGTLLIPPLCAQAIGTVVTVAGNGTGGFSGDGGQSTDASFNLPQFVIVARDGTIYIADWFNHRVRKVSATGIVSTVAGTGIPGFSGDGGIGTTAALNQPLGLALDSKGNLFIADTLNARIRKLTPEGIISTIAGSGAIGFGGDFGAATAASLNAPTRIAIDLTDNLYIADQNNHRIRKVHASSGIIETVAGSGAVGPANGGFSGDGGAATSARFNHPTAVAVDSAGNIYVADQLNHRVRKVGENGIINTFAGSGSTGFNGDGIPAVSASIHDPAGIAVDDVGNVYVADNVNARIRKIDPTGLISTTVGNGSPGFSGDGGPATSASINNPFGVTLDSEGNLYFTDGNNHRVRKLILGVPPFQISPASLGFTATPDSTSITRQVIVSSAVDGTGWSLGGVPWLFACQLPPPPTPPIFSVSPSSGVTPATLTITVNPTGLPPCIYSIEIPVQSAQGTATLHVTLDVAASPPPTLGVSTFSLVFRTQAGSNPPLSALQILNTGGGSLNWTAQTITDSGGNWLSISASSGTATAANASVVAVSASAAALAPGTFTGTISVRNTADNQTVTVNVTLVVTASNPTIQLTRTGLTFTALQGTSQTSTQTFGVLNRGSGVMNWSLQASTLSGGSGWLEVNPESGTSDAASINFPEVQVRVNPSGLAAGQYYGLIRVGAPGATNTPQAITVHLNVLAKWKTPPGFVQPRGIMFASPGGVSPLPQNIHLSTAAGSLVQVSVGVQTSSGGNWLDAQPRSIAVSPGASSSVSVSANLAGLAPGIYRGQITIQYNNGSPAQTVEVVIVVPSSSGPAPLGVPRAANGCAPTRLLTILSDLGDSFHKPVGWPHLVEAVVVDDCGNNVPDALVIASFSTGDPPLILQSLGNGYYSGTWVPLSQNGGPVAISARALLPPLADGVAQAQSNLQANRSVPLIFPRGLVNAASFAPSAPVSPGGIVSLFGRNLASPGSAPAVPLPITLGNATLNIGGIDVPLFFTSEGQMNVQLPAELSPSSLHQVYVRVTGPLGAEAISAPETIATGAARPGLFSINQRGEGQGAVLDGQGRLVDASAPTAAGEVVALFATGLGATQPPIPSGQGAPSSEPLARVTANVEARVGGRTARVTFAGLAPTFVGLYQVNVEIPAGVSTGSSVPVFILVDGVPSNIVTVALR